MESSKPSVVTKATRAPRRCSSELVPTVVPCSSTMAELRPVRCTASTMACEGSPGVENTFSIRRRPFSTHTQSVKVPPVSTATRARDGRFRPGLTVADALLCRWPAIERSSPMYHQQPGFLYFQAGPTLGSKPGARSFASESQMGALQHYFRDPVAVLGSVGAIAAAWL